MHKEEQQNRIFLDAAILHTVFALNRRKVGGKALR